jgi:TonB family protein
MRRQFSYFAALAVTCISGGVLAASTPPNLDSSGTNLQPNYPASAVPNREQGAIIVNTEITATGRVRRVLLLQSTGFADLDRAGIDAILGWHFIPAQENGQEITGWAKEKIVFTPPDANDTSRSGDSSAQAVSAYLPSDVSLVAPYDESVRQVKTIPCSAGTITAKVKMLRDKAPYFDPARAGLEVFSDSERTEISIIADNPVYPPMQGLGTRLEKNGKWVSGEAFDSLSLLRSEIVMSLTWSSSGLIAAGTRGFGTHSIEMSAPPRSFAFFAKSASAQFSDAQLSCWGPGQNPE